MWYTKKSETTTLSERCAQGFSKDAKYSGVALYIPRPVFFHLCQGSGVLGFRALGAGDG